MNLNYEAEVISVDYFAQRINDFSKSMLQEIVIFLFSLT